MMLNELKERIRLIPISTVIGKYLSVTKKGANYEAICPFHRDTHPSLKVSDQKNLFKCFVCGMAGDSITFIKEFKKLDFPEALKFLANDFGLAIPTSDQKPANPKIRALIECHELALKFYQELTSQHYQSELDSFAQSRKLSLDTLSQFKICYAPEGRHLADFLLDRKNKTIDQHYDNAMEIGLIKNGQNGHYDTFRRRILFPILNAQGQAVGFGSRATHDEQQPKYLNSQESIIFNKRQILYGLSLAKATFREQGHLFIVEGYMDAIMMHQCGFKNTVAVMGIALTEDHLKMLSPVLRSVSLLFDQDNAGVIAAQRALPLLQTRKITALRIDLLDTKDPDEFLRAHGSLAFKKQVELSIPWIDHLIEQKLAQPTGANVDAKLAVLHEIFQLLKPLGMELEATERAVAAAKKLGLSSPQDIITAQYAEALQKNIRPVSQTPKPKLAPIAPTEESVATTVPTLPLTQEILPQIEISKIEMMLIKHLLKKPQLFLVNGFTEVLEFVNTRQTKELLKSLQKVMMEVDLADFAQTSMSVINDRPVDPEIKKLASQIFFDWIPPQHLEEALLTREFTDLKKKLLMESFRFKRIELTKQHANLNDEKDINELLRQIHHLDTKMFELKMPPRPNTGEQKG